VCAEPTQPFNKRVCAKLALTCALDDDGQRTPPGADLPALSCRRRRRPFSRPVIAMACVRATMLACKRANECDPSRPKVSPSVGVRGSQIRIVARSWPVGRRRCPAQKLPPSRRLTAEQAGQPCPDDPPNELPERRPRPVVQLTNWALRRVHSPSSRRVARAVVSRGRLGGRCTTEPAGRGRGRRLPITAARHADQLPPPPSPAAEMGIVLSLLEAGDCLRQKAN
jgi:hypothetical protein